MSGFIPDQRDTITKRWTDVGYLGTDISVDQYAIKGGIVHIEGATHVASVEGSLAVTDAADAHITSNGVTLEINRAVPGGEVILTLKTPTALGAEKVTNGAFAADSDWTKATWTIGSGVATHATGTADNLEQDVSAVLGELYLLTFTVKTVTTAGALTPEVGGTAGTPITATAATAVAVTYNQEILAAGTGNLKFKADATWAGTIDDVICKKITPINVSLVAWR